MWCATYQQPHSSSSQYRALEYREGLPVFNRAISIFRSVLALKPRTSYAENTCMILVSTRTRILCGIIAVVVAIGTVLAVLQMRDHEAHWTRTQAVVVSNTGSGKNSSSIVKFQLPSGASVTARVSGGRGAGTNQAVLYDPANPQSADFVASKSAWWALLIAGAVVLGTGFVGITGKGFRQYT